MLKKLRKLFFSVLALCLILLATVSALVETETGSHWLVNRVAGLVDIQLGAMSGNLRRGLDIEFIEYQTADKKNENQHAPQASRYRAEQVSFRWRPADLLYSAVFIQSLQANKVRINIPAAVDDNKSSEPFNQWPHLRLPVRIRLDRLLIKDIEYQQGDTRLHWSRVSGSISWGTFHLRYKNLALMSDDYALLLSGSTSLAFPYTTDANLQWQWHAAATEEQPQPLQYMGTTDIKGNLQTLQLHLQTSLPVVLAADIQTALVDQQQNFQMRPTINLSAQWQTQTLPADWWVPEQPAPITSGKLNAQGHWENYQVQLDGDIYLPDAPALAVNGKAAGDLENIQIEHLRINELLPSLLLQNQSSPNQSSSNQSLSNQSLPNPLPQGLNIAGNVRWLPQLQWQLDAEAKQLNAASVFENWTSNINAQFNTQGGFDSAKQQWTAALQDLQLSGELRGVNLQGSGSVSFDGQQFRSPGLALTLGANQFTLKGDAGNSVALDWELNAPLLQQLDESIQGSIRSSGNLRGNWKNPRLQMTAAAEKFRWGNYAVEKLDLSLTPLASLQMGAEKNQPDNASDQTESLAAIDATGLFAPELLTENYQLAFSANQLRIADNRFSSIQLNGNGSFDKHQLQSVVKHTQFGRADIKLAGGYDGSEWRGHFEQLAVKLKKVPRWWLMSSKPIRINRQAVVMGAQCLTTRTNLTAAVEHLDQVAREQTINEWMPNQSFTKNTYDWLITQQPLPASSVERYSLPQLCVRGDWATNTGAKFVAQLDSVPLRQFLSLFKTEVYFAGVMDGSFHFASNNFTLADITADANITTRNAELRYQYTGGATEVYPWRDFKISAQLAQSQLNAHAGMEWTGYGRIDAHSQLDLAQKTIKQTTLQAAFSNLAPLETLLTFANDVKGDFRADLKAGGSFAKPYVLGEVSLRNGTANLPRLGLDLSNIELQINSTQAGSVNWVSQMQSGKGRLSIVGDLNQLGTPDWNVQGYVNGADFQVIALRELKATLTPNIKIIANKTAANITGDAVIPWARANIKSLPASATQVSDDAVIVDEKFTEDAPEQKMDILSNVTLSLGDDVTFKGFGLNSKLTGKVNLLKEAQRQFFTSGYVSVVDGSYKAYGQTLTIDRGRLLFQGSYENPGLEIRASRIIRDEENTKVGLDINGTLQRPKATVFSSPSVSDGEAMKMLMTGKPAGEFTKGDASLLLSAMGGLGMDSGGFVAADISQFFRLDELELKSDQGLDQSELWIGKYLTPKLLVRYVVGIFNKAFSVGMEYQLTDRLRLEAESGEAQSVDVVYKIEK
ncbi:translocation/assembly module TamB domain-containing protein [Cellvibrio sp. pealriver]|uniref:translocation/assembly module TamB domain-containing protein n=1 Tax=Cellvibrio sp. pealriver TaxID=1622269 RepID=UPI00066FE509|nr:translocation/assembly module TamB domain-containing protein [Cellvibrio sp. pealriver]